MTDEDAEKIFDEMKKFFGKNLVNPDHYPRIFAYQMKLFRYLKYDDQKTEHKEND